jgi:CO/xanthine dehydrogenase Mo-binding subunit
MRWDEHGWDNYGPAQLMDIRGGVDANGKIVAFEYTHFGIPGISQTLDDPTRQQVGVPLPAPGLGPVDTTNSGTQYNIPNRRVIAKSLPLFNNYFKTSSLRAPQAPQTCFGSEQMIDELAYAAGMDPYEFRLKNITTADQNQWRDVLVGVAKLAKWEPKVAASNLSKADVVHGRGIALGSFAGSQAGVVVDIEVNKKTGKITVKHVYQAASAGLAVSIGGIENQIVGGTTQILSRLLVEKYRYGKSRVTSTDFVTYPLLRFKDAPQVTPIVLQWSSNPLTAGVGEPVAVAPAAAVANAFFDATGVRLRTAPFTPARVRAALKAAGVA